MKTRQSEDKDIREIKTLTKKNVNKKGKKKKKEVGCWDNFISQGLVLYIALLMNINKKEKKKVDFM